MVHWNQFRTGRITNIVLNAVPNESNGHITTRLNVRLL